ncbi:MAG: S41 family peptidase [Bacteroidales bacterium]|nr:S41 family peptidase [Bacteroidales bacterium]
MKRSAIFILAILFFGLSPRISAQNDFEIVKNVDIFISILNELNDKYADEISPGELTQTAIKAMLKSLDPYTVYYPEADIESYRMSMAGDHSDVDVAIQNIDGKMVITDIMENSPSAKAGLRVGDQILKVNTQNASSSTVEGLQIAMRGQPGSTYDIEIFRPTDNKNLNFKIKREKIKQPNIPYSGVLGDKVGYIKLNQFLENAGKEIHESFDKLKEEGIEYLIIDLRDNGGGLLGEAVNIIDLFVGQDIAVVETKGKIEEMNRIYKTHFPAVDADIPIVVLVNEHSASASEIVSGTLQDLDRAVIVGKKSFGKGLVQKVFPMDYNTSMKITVSKYYIPSGRCVQNIEYFDRDTTKGGYKIPDSLAVAYKTKNGRTVYDKGGVEPDVPVSDEVVPDILSSLIEARAIFDFANDYRAKHETIAEAEKFTVDDAIYNEFLKYLKEKQYAYTSSLEETLAALKEKAEDEKSFSSIQTAYNQLKTQLENLKTQDLTTHKAEISRALTQEIVSRYYYSTGKLINSLHHDAYIDAAKSVLLNKSRYQSILSPKS